MSLINSIFNTREILKDLEKQDLLRKCPVVTRIWDEEDPGKSGSRFTMTGSGPLLNFASNDYLGLSTHPAILRALREGLEKYGAGSGASPLVTGLSPVHEELMERLRAITGKEGVLLFSTGFSANQALMKACMTLNAGLFPDRLSHASMQDMAFYAKRLSRFRHNDAAHLEKLLRKAPGPGVIATEGVFSMDGDQAPLKKLLSLREQYRTPLILDDAHGFGVLGRQGHGSPDYQGTGFQNIDVYMGTFSKALGLSGAFAAGARDFTDFMVNTSREYIYSTMAPAFLAQGALKALDIIEGSEGAELRSHLKALVSRFQNAMKSLLPERCPGSETAIQPVIIGDAGIMMRVSEELKAAGILLGSIRPPTVPRGSARLRITLTAAHREEDADFLAEKLHQIIRKLGQEGYVTQPPAEQRTGTDFPDREENL